MYIVLVHHPVPNIYLTYIFNPPVNLSIPFPKFNIKMTVIYIYPLHSSETNSILYIGLSTSVILTPLHPRGLKGLEFP